MGDIIGAILAILVLVSVLFYQQDIISGQEITIRQLETEIFYLNKKLAIADAWGVKCEDGER